MKKPYIITDNTKTIIIHAANTIPHNILFFTDNNTAMKTKNILWNKYRIPTNYINRWIENYCTMLNIEYNSNLVSILYFNSRHIIDPELSIPDYFVKPYEKVLTINL